VLAEQGHREPHERRYLLGPECSIEAEDRVVMELEGEPTLCAEEEVDHFGHEHCTGERLGFGPHLEHLGESLVLDREDLVRLVELGLPAARRDVQEGNVSFGEHHHTSVLLAVLVVHRRDIWSHRLWIAVAGHEVWEVEATGPYPVDLRCHHVLGWSAVALSEQRERQLHEPIGIVGREADALGLSDRRHLLGALADEQVGHAPIFVTNRERLTLGARKGRVCRPPPAWIVPLRSFTGHPVGVRDDESGPPMGR